MSARHYTLFDKFICGADRAIRTLTPGTQPQTRPRPEPDSNSQTDTLTDLERKHSAGLMRVNHSGEVCAQALYQGQALTAKLPEVRVEMEQAADEEVDHLAWCEQRLDQLGSHTSVLNPLWYGLSFSLGAGAGLISDKISLGFVAATEQQVCKHLEKHLQQLPGSDTPSRAIVQQMLDDEGKHADAALNAGGAEFPKPVKWVMSAVAKVMTTTSYRL